MRLAAFLVIPAVCGLSACVETAGPGGAGQRPDVAERCVARTARAIGVQRADLTVIQSLSYPEGDLVTITVPGQGKVQCRTDVDGAMGDLLWVEGGPSAAPSAPAPAPAG